MRLTLTSAQAQSILDVINAKLSRGEKAPTYSIQIGFGMGTANTNASPGHVGRLLTGLADYLETLADDFPVVLDVTLYANHQATQALTDAVQDELRRLAQEQAAKISEEGEGNE